MPKPLSYWADTPSTQQMMKYFGGSTLPEMDTADKTAMLCILALATDELVRNGGECTPLNQIPKRCDIDISEPCEGFLRSLDNELDADSLLQLMHGIITLIPVNHLKGN